ncbi:MAG: hypothetical protein QXI19_11530 [Candidatus Caldarchaeum sp.]
MDNHDALAIADALLGMVPRDPECPHYTTATFERKLRRSRERERDVPLGRSSLSEAVLYLRRNDLMRAVYNASLTRRQLEVFLARVRGESWTEIGRKHGHTKQGAFQIFRQALKKVLRAWHSDPYRDLAWIYREEVMRGWSTRPL